MALRIETFDNARGGNALYKALTHPCAARRGRELVRALAGRGPVTIYDPSGAAAAFNEIFALDGVGISGVFVQDVAKLGETVLGHRAAPVSELARADAGAVFLAAFDAAPLVEQLRPVLPESAEILSLDAMRIPGDRLGNRARYLDPLNFATNFAFFRDTDRLHTRLVTANYWAGYGAPAPTLWLTLFSGEGEVIAEWCERLDAAAQAIVIDSREVRARFDLPEFTGQLFLHVVGAAGHDIVKYALDTFGEEETDASLSATHDANSWPADRYAGLPAPAPGEEVVLWLQNSHPIAIPAGAVGLNPMGEEEVVWLAEGVAPFATARLDVGRLLPGLQWPRQIELRAGKHMVRPRYEIVENARHRIAHVNVERGDLAPDAALPGLSRLLGKGYLLPAPILPRALWRTELLPTPMAIRQAELPIALIAYDPEGNEIARRGLGRLPRGHGLGLDLDAISGVRELGDGYGHIELVYDFSEGGEGDGWLHALFRYRRRDGGHAAETSFGAHVFNTILTYKGEPQSYSGRPPGLSTRLFLRLGEAPFDTLCHLIYPASLPWRRESATEIILFDRAGREAARKRLAIPCSGSRLWRYHELFDAATRGRAGAGAYAVVRDTTCRLFGYHGLLGRDGAFSLDHMFGF
ncbi:MAG TPA: hypothetical protein VM755_15650 [Stellaceae bacterium]|nr:hypothetical protein [Stellaceae bacterium]